MEYQDYIELQDRMYANLTNEQDYYAAMCTQLTIMLLLISTNNEDIANIIYEFFKDLIDDAQKEREIVSLIKLRVEKIVDEFTEVYFEGCPEYMLYSKILMRINNSSKKRASYAYPYIAMFYNLITHQVLQKGSYNIIKRKKYLKESEYESYFEVLKK